MALVSTIDLEAVEIEVQTAQAAVKTLLDNETRASEKFEEITALADQPERLNSAATLVAECEGLALLAKEMKETAERAMKRMDKVAAGIIDGIFEEVEELGGEIELADWILKIKKKPAKVEVDNLADVPQKYRLEPKPLPPCEEWPADKNLIKQALVKDKVKSIKGISLSVGQRLEIKPR